MSIPGLPRPFLGRAILEAIVEDVEAYMKEKSGVSRDSVLALPDAYKTKYSIPLKKGKIIEMSPDFCGEKFRESCGSDTAYYKPALGDVLWFVPNETYALDIEKKYHLINDSDIVAYEKAE